MTTTNKRFYLKDFKKSFGSHCLFQGLKLSIEPGEIVSLQGRSGEGKTTLLRCLCGLETLDQGEVFFGDQKLPREARALSSYIGLVFQDFQLFPHLSLWDNLMQAPKAKRADMKEAAQRAEQLLLELGIDRQREAFPHKLSGGQQQRAAIARALMLSPKLLCFDEPTSSLDEASIQDVMQLLRHIADQGTSLFIVTHDRAFARALSDRILHLQHSRLLTEPDAERSQHEH